MNKSGVVMLLIILSFATFRAQELSVTITQPLPRSQFEKCTDIQITAEVQQLESIPIRNVKFTRNKIAFKTDTKPPYEYLWKEVPPGYYELVAIVTDDSANVVYSDPVWINVGERTVPNLVSNGYFDCGKAPWQQMEYEGADASFTLYENSWLSEGGIAEVSVINPGSFDWHIQLQQGIALDSGHTYLISFKADASTPRTFSFMLQYDQDPWDIYYQQSMEFEEAGMFGPYQFDCNVTDHLAILRFNVGLVESDVYFDDIVITDASITAAPESDIKFRTPDTDEYIISGNYPNPFNANTTIHYHLPQASTVSLTIYTLTGQELRTLVNGHQNAGDHRFIWDGKNRLARDVPSGIYIYKIEVQTQQKLYSVARKIILIK
jgi:hypothetical protein